MATGKRFRDLVEVLLDAHAPDVEQTLDAIGDPSPTSEPTLIELATYVRARTRISEGESDKVLQWAEKDRQQITALALPVEKAKMINPRPTLAYAEAALYERAVTVSYELIAAITTLESPWRYAFRVMTEYAAGTTKSKDFLSLFQTHLQDFGNDHELWYATLLNAQKGSQWIGGLFELLVRELEVLPHEPEGWKAAALLLGQGDDGQSGFDEISSRLREQSTLG